MRRAPAALLAAAALSLAALAPSAGAATPAPAWNVNSLPVPTNFAPGGEGQYEMRIANQGGEPSDGSEITIVDTLPAGLTVTKVELPLQAEGELLDFGATQCETETSGEVQTVTCVVPPTLPESQPAFLRQSEAIRMIVYVDVPADASGTLVNSVQVKGGGALPATASSENPVSSEPAEAGFQEFRSDLTGPDGLAVTQAGSHPYQYTTSFAVHTVPGNESAPFLPAEGDLKDVEVRLPPGLIGDPTASTLCTAQQFNTVSNAIPTHPVNECPDGAAVGVIVVQQLEGIGGVISAPIYNIVPPKGMPAQLGFQIASLPFYIDTSLRSGEDYGISAHLRNTSQLKRVTAASVTIWGTPGEESHDTLRGSCLNNGNERLPLSLGSCTSGITPVPFFRLPTSCESPLLTETSFSRWNAPTSFVFATSSAPAPIGCDALDFSPTIAADPQVTVADSPTGLAFNLHLPQISDPELPGTADLRDARVTLPPGLVLNPASAAGLQGCSPAQIDLSGAAPASCPNASKVGTVEVHTPLLDHPVKGGVFVATPHQNPFGSLIAIYIAAEDAKTGIVLKLAGRVELDPATGRLATTFADNPQLPFEDLKVDFFDGPRAPLRTPATCGTYTVTSALRPWSAPASGPDATPSDSFAVTTAPGGGPCAPDEAQLPHSPGFEAGTLAPLAGAHSPFLAHLSRDDGSQTLRGLNVTLPQGLTGKLAGIPYCPEAQIAAAGARSGRSELDSPSCSAQSRIGSVAVGAGAGPSPFFVAGTAYLAPPYKGAPLSAAIITPAVAGPFDLGTVVVRAALHIDPRSAQISAISDPFPTILAGIPLDLRRISIQIDRPNFMLNPTDCSPSAVAGEAISILGRSAQLADRFQVGGCRGLEFSPKLRTRLSGGTKRGAHPALRAVLTPRAGDANIERIVASLPRSEFLDQAHIRTVCTRVQFAADQCPPGSIYGNAVAHSPLLDAPLRGPVYMRSSNNKLPDLVIALSGQVEIEVAGRVDSIRGGIRTTFADLPDVPVSKFVLNMRGGKRGLLINSRDICSRAFRVQAQIGAQNGKRALARPLLVNRGCGG